MNGFIFGFSATLLSAMLWPSLLPISCLPYLCLGALILFKKAPSLSGVLFAMCWLTGFCLVLSRQELPLSQQPIHVRGEIISLVSQNSDWVSFDIIVDKPNLIFVPRAKLRLTWQSSETLQVGQVWSFTLMPKSISSVLNQGGYNEQKQLISQHIVGKGRVLHAKLQTSHFSLRNHLIEQLAPKLSTLAQGDILLALILGDKQLISASKWQDLRQTGTGHLVAISGLHLSVITAWVYSCILFLLTRVAAHPSRRNLVIALLLAGASAFFYSYLAGFAVSTQRALVMILLIMLLSLLRRYSSAWDRLLFALFIVLLVDPLACLSAGFWLSFCALAIILYTLESAPVAQSIENKATFMVRARIRFAQFWSIQWRLSLVLGLVQAIFFGGLSVHSLWINMLVVPWFSLIVIPLSMLALIIWWIGTLFGQSWFGFFNLADVTLLPYGKLLELSGDLPAHWYAVSETLLAGSLCALLAMILWRYLPHHCRYGLWHLPIALLFIPLILLILQRITEPSSPKWTLHLLDVGQGLAVVIEQENRALIYDTGAAYGEGFSYSERVIIPFLNRKGVALVDYIVVSHGDNDHAGGAKVLAKAYPSANWITDVAHLGGTPCLPQQIQWLQLKLSFISPPTATGGNNASCVLRIDDGVNSLLLSGDIEKETEALLIAQSLIGTELKSKVLIAPHHGSRTSSTPAFIDAVAPELVLFPAGLNNRYGFPKPDVVARYQARQISYLTTGLEGQISVNFTNGRLEVKTYRRDLAPFWYNRLFRFGDLINPE
ncbi:DNA internalization-related competence protein ComEC/Rec2 [Shewanella sp. MR-4]|uniref:DNA internalization-related competence protein ComEC/Rec2 n=1 Tax=Shewanella sp. (strain MR-4) TaxID=60480 RepID=UPI00005E545E|nr:DNA internalization-related competence protein ComEC/Rec2 [Shewanella sp. MR-4]ABI39494.1 DNA internalization-related competence protein ComEC/Rec2 [Shewanella sp. MR-4]